MANEGLGRGKNKQGKQGQPGGVLLYIFCLLLQCKYCPPPPALGFWPTVRCPVRKGVPSSKKALGVTTSGEPDNQVIQCEEQTSKNSSPVYQTFALFRTEHAAGSAVCQLRASLLYCMMRVCKAGASHPHLWVTSSPRLTIFGHSVFIRVYTIVIVCLCLYGHTHGSFPCMTMAAWPFLCSLHERAGKERPKGPRLQQLLPSALPAWQPAHLITVLHSHKDICGSTLALRMIYDRLQRSKKSVGFPGTRVTDDSELPC